MSVKRDERRPSRPWIIDIPYKDARTGKRRRYFKNARLQTADGARREDRLLLTILAEKGYIPDLPEVDPESAPQEGPKELTFSEAIKLYEETLKPQLKRSTQLGYEKSIDAYLKDRFGHLTLSQIDKVSLVAFDQELTHQGLSASTRNNIIIPLRTIITNAVELGRHDRLPDFPRLNRVKSKVYEPPTPGEVEQLLNAADEHARLAIALAAYAGLRAGEVRGLRWGDVNLKSRTLFVRQSICHGKVDTPKSGHERAIPIGPRLFDMLNQASKDKQGVEAPVAPTLQGRHWTESGLRCAFERALSKGDLPHIRFHDLRHAFITRCFKGGASAPTVQKLAGHLHLSVTQRYAHTDEVAMRQAVQVFT